MYEYIYSVAYYKVLKNNQGVCSAENRRLKVYVFGRKPYQTHVFTKTSS